MKYAFKEPGKDVIVKEVKNLSLKLLQQQVEGYIELVYNPFSPEYNDINLVLVCNESALIENKKVSIVLPGGMHICGNIVLCYYPNKADEDLTGLNDKQLSYIDNIKDKIQPAINQSAIDMLVKEMIKNTFG